MLKFQQNRKKIYNIGIHSHRLVHIVSHSDHVTVRQYALIHANVPDINVCMNAVTNIFVLVLLDVWVSINT